MTCGRWMSVIVVASGALACLTGTVRAQSSDRPASDPRSGREQLTQPVYRVAQPQPDGGPRVANNNLPQQQNLPPQQNVPQPPNGLNGQHPLVPALQMAYASLNNIRSNIKDYSATMVKRERIGAKLGEQEFMFLKVRHQPFSVYMYFLGPDRIKGQEALYVDGKNNGNLLGHGVGIRKIAGTVPLQPTGAMAMAGQRYPITEIGIANLTRRLVEVAEQDMKFGECEVKFFKGAKINKRSATVIQVIHPVPRKNFLFHKAMVFVDDELNIPVRYESWDWPEKPGGEPLLMEEYTYMNIKLNNGFTDADFDDKNPSYSFR